MLWYCYIDNVFFIWTHREEKLASFLNVLNNHHPNIKFTNKSYKEHIPFSDLNMGLSENKLSVDDLHIKSTERHPYLCYSSSHVEQTKNLLLTAKL